MIERYAIKEIEDIFSLENRYETFLKVELSVLKAYVKLGIVPEEDYLKILKHATVNLDKINELEKETKHDVIAFTRSLSLELGEEKKWIHYNLTSTDVVDTALSLNLKEANEIILKHLSELKNTLNDLAKKYEYTPIIGRTHGIHGEVTSFGLKWALFLDELIENIFKNDEHLNNKLNYEISKINEVQSRANYSLINQSFDYSSNKFAYISDLHLPEHLCKLSLESKCFRSTTLYS